MSDFFTNLAARVLQPETLVRPRLASRFEPALSPEGPILGAPAGGQEGLRPEPEAEPAAEPPRRRPDAGEFSAFIQPPRAGELEAEATGPARPLAETHQPRQPALHPPAAVAAPGLIETEAIGRANSDRAVSPPHPQAWPRPGSPIPIPEPAPHEHTARDNPRPEISPRTGAEDAGPGRAALSRTRSESEHRPAPAAALVPRAVAQSTVESNPERALLRPAGDPSLVPNEPVARRGVETEPHPAPAAGDTPVRAVPAPPPVIPVAVSVRTREAAAEPRPARGEAAAPTIHVTIGRIEVRAATAPARPARSTKAPAPMLSLDEYLRRRSKGGAS